jgi:dihydroorotate dehydrogenase electron transfer subunit
MAGGEAMPAVGATRPRRLDLPVIGHRRLGGEFVRISLGAPPDWHSMPGQFINVLCESDLAALAASEGRPLDDAGADWPLTTGLEIARRWPVVRRPYSISRVDRAGGTVILEVMVRGVGLGSRFLQARPVGSSLNVVGPLGNSFTAPADDRLCILVGGGCGVAPIYGLADYLAGVGKRAIVIFGASDVGDMPVLFRRRPEPTDGRAEPTDIVDEFAEVGVRTILATEDGSAGFRGFATAALAVYLRDVWKGEPPALYGCGPTPMLKALAQVAAGRGLPCQLSLERFMGCGIGVCLSCVTKRRDAASETGWTHRLTCREGPVVEASEMIWDS